MTLWISEHLFQGEVHFIYKPNKSLYVFIRYEPINGGVLVRGAAVIVFGESLPNEILKSIDNLIIFYFICIYLQTLLFDFYLFIIFS